jgi:hypothetical protein
MNSKTADERRDAVLLQMLKTRPKPHKEMKVGKPRGRQPVKKPAARRKAREA